MDTSNPYYRIIKEHYGKETATRSKVPLINHIKEGITILEYLKVRESTKEAFCIHPIFQDDESFTEISVSLYNPEVVMLTTEYRHIANSYRPKDYNYHHVIKVSPLIEVNLMLLADKIQNEKDYFRYHERTQKYDDYFHQWISTLFDNVDIPMKEYYNLVKLIEEK